MKKIERIALWLVSLILILTGIISIVWQTFGQGKIGQDIPPIKGPLAAVFGTAFVAIGVYFACVLWRSSTEARRRGRAEEPLPERSVSPEREAGRRLNKPIE